MLAAGQAGRCNAKVAMLSFVKPVVRMYLFLLFQL